MKIQHENEKVKWYIMHSYKNEARAEKMLADNGEIEYFIPKEPVIRIRHGEKRIEMVPVITSLIFLHASQKDIVNFKKNIYNDLQFMACKGQDGIVRYLTVRDKEMANFLLMYNQSDKKITYMRPEEINITKGQRVKIHGGAMDTMEGLFVKVAHKRSRQIVVIIPDVFAASVEVEPQFIEVLK